MSYRISARHPGRVVTYTAATEEDALAKCDELAADDVPFEITGPDGAVIDDLDLEALIDAREAGED